MELPKFVIADNSDYPDDLFVIHLEYPRFIINIATDEVSFLEELDEEDEAEIEAEMEDLIAQAGAFYDKEMTLYEE